MSVQGYFEYDAKKSSGWTISHLRFSPKTKIEAPFRVEENSANYVACHNESYVQANKFDVIKFLKRRGTFFLNTTAAAIEDPQKRIEALEQMISPKILRNLALRNIEVCNVSLSLAFSFFIFSIRQNSLFSVRFSSTSWTQLVFPDVMDLLVESI